MSSPISLAALAPVMKRIMVDTVEMLRPGPQVLNEDTGEYEPGPDVIVWEGLGAVFAAGGPGMVMSLAGQAYQDDTRDRYRLLTPLEAPLASRDDCVRVTNATTESRAVGPGVAGAGHLRRQHSRGGPHHAGCPELVARLTSNLLLVRRLGLLDVRLDPPHDV